MGFSALGFGWMFSKLVKERTDIHQADAYLEVLKAIGVKNFSNNGLEIWTDQNTRKNADSYWPKEFNRVKVIGHRGRS